MPEKLKIDSTVYMSLPVDIIDRRVHSSLLCKYIEDVGHFDPPRGTLEMGKIQKIVSTGIVKLYHLDEPVVICDKCCELDVYVCPHCGEILELGEE